MPEFQFMKTYFFVMCFLAAGLTNAQERKILGRVLDRETKKPIYNANIVIVNSSRGAVSNAGGFFELTLDAYSFYLRVSYVGYKTTEIQIPADNKFMFYMDRERTKLPALILEDYPKPPIQAKAPAKADSPKGFKVVEAEAFFPGGMDQFYLFIGNALAKSLTTKPKQPVNLTFTIDENGKATRIGVSDSAAISLSEVINAFSDMPQWTPGSQREVNVPQDFTLPVLALQSMAKRSMALNDYVFNTISYPVQARRMGVEGQVLVEFTIDKGTLTVTLLLRDIGGDCGVEVTRVLSAAPAEVVASLDEGRYILPVSFGLEERYERDFKGNIAGVVTLPTVHVVAMGIKQDRRVGSYTLSPGAPTSKTEFSDLEQALKNADQAEALILTKQGLESLPADVGLLTKMKKLDLEGNQLTTLPREVLSLSSLRELYLFDNRFEKVPAGISQLTNLVVLGLARNSIKEIPDELSQMKKLEALDLSRNRIEEVPASIAKIKRLRVLSLQGNAIHKLPPEFYTINGLEKLDLTGNPLDPGQIEYIRSRLHGTLVYF